MWSLWLPAQAEKGQEQDTPWACDRDFPVMITGVSTLGRPRSHALHLSGKSTVSSSPPGHSNDNNHRPELRRHLEILK